MTDIQGPEDEFGGMDFKVAGTRAGVTAIQLDIKLDGIPPARAQSKRSQAPKVRATQILDVIEKEIATPRANISPRAPGNFHHEGASPTKSASLSAEAAKQSTASKIVTGVQDITIEDDGSVFITGKGGTAQKAKEMIEAVVKEYKAGEVYDGEVTRLMDFGAFVRIGPGKDAEGLVHVSEVAPFRIAKISEAVSSWRQSSRYDKGDRR